MHKEIQLFLIGVIAGIILAAVFDAGRAMRAKIPQGGFLTSIEDFSFWMFTGFFLFSILEKYNKGVLRFYVFFGVGIGVLFYCIVLHRPLYFCFTAFFFFIGSLLSIVKIFFRKMGRLVKNLIIFPLKNVIKQITMMIRNN